MNESRTGSNSDTDATQPRSAFDHASALTRLRNASGFNTPAWHVYTKLMEQLENYPPDWIDYLEPDGVKEQRRNLNKSIGQSLTELAKLTAA